MATGDSRPTVQVVIYTTPTCAWCRVAKRYFAEHDVAFREVDVTKDRRGAREMLLMTGGRAVPVIRVGSHAMTGWDVHEFERLRSGRFKRR
jgi:glutaredoxin 3